MHSRNHFPITPAILFTSEAPTFGPEFGINN